MAIIQSGVSGSTLMTVDPTYAAARVSPRPIEQLNTFFVGMQSGAVNPGTNGFFGNVRFVAGSAGQAQYMIVQKIQVAVVVAAAITTSQEITVGAFVARSYTANDTTGSPTVITMTGNNQKARTSLPTSQLGTGGSIQIANVTGISGGTRTNDGASIGIATGTSGTAVGTTCIPLTTIYEWSGVTTPIVIANNEGLMFQNFVALATGTARYTVNITWTESATTSTTSF